MHHPSRHPAGAPATGAAATQPDAGAGIGRAPWRRHLAAIALAASALVGTTAPRAQTPPAFEQVPGVQRQAIDGLQVTALFDGVVALTLQQLKDSPPARNRTWMRTGHVPALKDGYQTAVNAFLVRRGSELLLIDAGTADCFGPGLGQVPANLRAAGVRPEDIDHVLVTHGHGDHACGLRDADGQATYPKATVWLSQADAAFWLDPAVRDRAPEAMRAYFDMPMRAVAPYQASGRLRTFAPGAPLPAGVKALDTHGHTPGHTSWLVDGLDGKPALLLWGDVVHYHAVQFRDPGASFEFDANRRDAIASRRRVLAQAAREDWWVGGAHLPFPGLGHVVRDGKGYRWVPTEFGPVATP